MMMRTIFLDKDGTLIEDNPYNADIAGIRFADGVWDALNRLNRNGYRFVIISNQSGLAHGYFSPKEFDKVARFIGQEFDNHYLPLEGFYYCPHHPDGSVKRFRQKCFCRKPQPGLLIRAARELNIACSISWGIGDILHDVEAAHRAGCRAAFLDNGHETEWDLSGLRQPDVTAKNFHEIAERILTYDENVALDR